MSPHLRVARPVSDPEASARMYARGLGLQELGRFDDHDGFDGRMLGTPGAGFHLEFTRSRAHVVRPAPTPEDLLVFYVPDRDAWRDRCAAMLAAGFRAVPSFNPYWERSGRTFEDGDGYRVVIERDDWSGRA
jgi:catechol 2,3-dioxygenase-like lactoylglutathione lyase family enzyme